MASDDVETVYLTRQDALGLYAAFAGGTPADAANVLRSPPALDGALERPRSYARYQDADLALQAAVLAQGIAESQPFLDGNKRLALVAMLTFLELNGYRVEATDPELADWIIGLSDRLTPEGLAKQLRQRLSPPQPT